MSPSSVHTTLKQRLFNAWTLNRHCFNVACLLGTCFDIMQILLNSGNLRLLAFTLYAFTQYSAQSC